MTGSIKIISAILLWSSLGVIVRLAGTTTVNIIFYSSSVAVLIQLPVILLRGFRNMVPDIGAVKYPLVLGLILLINTFAYYFAFQNTTIANAVLTHYTAPVIVAFLAPVFLKEKISRLHVAAIVLASAGLWIMLDGFSLSSGHSAGILSGLASGLAYAVLIIFARSHAGGVHTLVFACFSNMAIVFFLAPFVREVPLNALSYMVIMGVMHSTIAPLLYYDGLKTVTAGRAGVLGYLEPVGAIIFSMVFLDELPGIYSLAGGALILVSGYITLMRNNIAENGSGGDKKKHERM